MKIDYVVKFKSDFHTGSGAGIPGVIDNGLKFDAEGIPEISGKTVKGLLRDAIMSLTHIHNDGRVDEIMKIIFGKEGEDETCFRFNTPTVDSNTRRRIRNNPRLPCRISSVNTRNAIDRGRLTAKKGALFSVEVAPSFFEYLGSITQIKEFHSSIKEAVLFYIIGGLRFITHLGGNRRRGSGLLRFEIKGLDDGVDKKKWEEIIQEGLPL
ncbi:MAG: hypothetical protein IBX72_09730 [Nitrospirae bacterium]|nr:hypothetical protein [Nitrospirota bacterium]